MLGGGILNKHKWHKEICAWANGAEIEVRFKDTDKWLQNLALCWEWEAEYRIKPQPKEPQYLYVYQLGYQIELGCAKHKTMQFLAGDRMLDFAYIGKIKLEQDDD